MWDISYHMNIWSHFAGLFDQWPFMLGDYGIVDNSTQKQQNNFNFNKKTELQLELAKHYSQLSSELKKIKKHTPTHKHCENGRNQSRYYYGSSPEAAPSYCIGTRYIGAKAPETKACRFPRRLSRPHCCGTYIYIYIFFIHIYTITYYTSFIFIFLC